MHHSIVWLYSQRFMVFLYSRVVLPRGFKRQPHVLVGFSILRSSPQCALSFGDGLLLVTHSIEGVSQLCVCFGKLGVFTTDFSIHGRGRRNLLLAAKMCSHA